MCIVNSYYPTTLVGTKVYVVVVLMIFIGAYIKKERPHYASFSLDFYAMDIFLNLCSHNGYYSV